jgi:DNA-binding XRE family transcriptional regulator
MVFYQEKYFSQRKSMYDNTRYSTFGNELMMLYGRSNLSQGEFARLVGISSVALRKWESGESCPKAESLKRVIETLLSKGAFSQGEEQAEAMHLWELANKKGLKVPFDEAWFKGVMQGQASAGEDRIGARHDPYSPCPVPRADPVPTRSGAVQGEEENLTVPPSSDGGDAHLTTLDTNLRTKKESVGTDSLALAPTKTRGRRKRLLLIALVILTIIGSAGALLFYARNHTITEVNNGSREQASKIATDQAYPGYLSRHGTLAFFDPLSQEGGSKWSSRTGSYGSACRFTGGAYHASQSRLGAFRSCAANGIFSNFAFEVQLTIIQGDCGGMLFRNDIEEHFYYFHICQDGAYRVLSYVSDSGSSAKILQDSSSLTIHIGLGQHNKIAIVANGSTLTFYVNEQQIDQEQDSSSTSGTISLIANPRYGNVTDVAYRNARLWTL